MFLTPGALYILVVDLFAYLEEHSREDALDQWFDILQSRVPGSVVLLVGTHSDSFGANSAKYSERTDNFKRGGSCGNIFRATTTCFVAYAVLGLASVGQNHQ